jgi:plastocyanin
VKALAIALLALSALALAPAQASVTKRVSIVDDAFSPRSIAVRKGGSVTWSWRGRHRHNVLWYSGPRSGRPRRCPTQRRGLCTRRFPRTGRYEYVCTLHGTMAGAVRVR